MYVIFVFLLGLILGSFCNVLIYRVPLGLGLGGRSYCPKCKHQLSWLDNVPLLSFLFLRSRCRYCSKVIPFRYFIVELVSGLFFVLGYYLLPFNYWLLFVFVFPLLLALFVIDWQRMILPDELIFTGVLITFVFFLDSPFLWRNLLSGFVAGLFLLLLYLVTLGKGMGLGDVKLAILGGLLLGPYFSLIWLTVAFLTGAVFGVILILGKKAKLKSKIAFGPFLILALVGVLFFSV